MVKGRIIFILYFTFFTVFIELKTSFNMLLKNKHQLNYTILLEKKKKKDNSNNKNIGIYYNNDDNNKDAC